MRVNKVFTKRSSPLLILSVLTLLSLLTQLLFFTLHSQSAVLIDDLVGSSIPSNFFHWAVWSPIAKFLIFQVLAYAAFIRFLLFLVQTTEGRFSAYSLAWLYWALASAFILALNQYSYPASFFGQLLPATSLNILLPLLATLFLSLIGLAYYRAFTQHKQRLTALGFLGLALLLSAFSDWNHVGKVGQQNKQPNIIMIGLDSLRPDFTSYAAQHEIRTPEIDAFLRSSLYLKEAYTPLARTYPAWVSILTAQFPKHSHSRLNLSYAPPVLAEENLAKRLQAAGYRTLYATDEKRFSNITPAYGFDKVLGPAMGLSDFILGGLSDLPLTNLLINLPAGRYFFPYNYANRAAAVTYEPDKFMDLLARGLGQQGDKPVFIAVHFCVSHWPFTWAKDQQGAHFKLEQRYASSVQKADEQLGQLLALLKARGYLEHSLVVLLSDHGTTIGLPGDRSVKRANYQGEASKMAWLTVNRYSRAPRYTMNLKKDYNLDTSYGQGTDILSLKQYRILLALKGYGLSLPVKVESARASLLDLAPTILSYLALPALPKAEGASLLEPRPTSKPFYMETGYSVSDIESDKISVEQVVKHSIHLYGLDPQNGYLFVKPEAEKSVLSGKQRAVLYGDWLLARYPESRRERFGKAKSYVLAPYYVLVNVKTGLWTIGFDGALAKQAPLRKLRKVFDDFYGDEI